MTHAEGAVEHRLRRPSGRAVADILGLSLLTFLGAIGFQASFGGDGYVLPALGGMVAGTAVGIGAYMFRLGAVTTTFAAVVSYYLLGSALAVPSQAILGFLPSLQSLASLTTGAVFGWADIVTLSTPVGAPAYIAVVPYFATWLVALITTTLATRWLDRPVRAAWRSGIALIGPVVLYLAGILTGTDDPFLAAIRGAAFAVIALVWVGWRRAGAQKVSLATGNAIFRRKLVGSSIVVAAAVVLGVTAGSLVLPQPEGRFVLREEITPPFDPLDYPSPLSAFRKYTKVMPDAALFTIEGLESGERVRLATMDSYTGKLWNVAGQAVATDGSGSFTLVGKDITDPKFLTIGRTADISVVIGDYRDVWMPGIGYPTAIRLSGPTGADADNLRYNPTTGSTVLTSGLTEGDSYSMTALVQKPVTKADLAGEVAAGIQQPSVDDVPGILISKAKEFVGDTETAIDQLTALEVALHSGYLSHGLLSDVVPSTAGHGADRMTALFEASEMVGDEEQYASAFALMARELGYSSRVILGFAPADAGAGGPVEVKGSDITAWPEVAFENVGWVAFDPTPEQTDVPQDQKPKPKSDPQPQVRQPPRSEAEQDDLLSDVEIDNSEEDPPAFSVPGWLVAVGLSVGIPLALYFLPLLLVAFLKRRRMQRRRSIGTTDRRAAGAWDELVDTYVELGYAASRKETRLGLASDFERQFQEQIERRVAERIASEQGSAARELAKERLATAKVERGRAGAALDSTVLRAKTVVAWRPGTVLADDQLPGLPELREFAHKTDAAVFSGLVVPETDVDSLWEEAIESAKSARTSVSWLRQQIARFRIRPRRDLIDALAVPDKLKPTQLVRGVLSR